MTNRFTNNPQWGDAVVGNLTTGKVEYIKGETLDTSALGSGYETIGVVVRRTLGKVLVAYKEEASKAWCPYLEWVVTGGSTSGGTIVIRSYSTDTSYQDVSITYTGSTLQEICNSINVSIQKDTYLKSQKWYMFVSGEEIHAIRSYTHWGQVNTKIISGGSMSYAILPDMAMFSTIRRRNGFKGANGAVGSLQRTIAYLKGSSVSSEFNVTSNITSVKRQYPVTYAAYTDSSNSQYQYCDLLRSTYGEGEEGWLRHVKSCMPVNPCEYGNMGQDDDYAKGITKYLAEATLPDAYVTAYSLSDNHYSPAGVYAHGISTNVLPAGSFHIPSIAQVCQTLDGIEYGTNSSRTADKVNATLYKMGGSALSNGSYRWSACRFNASYAWNVYGSNGCAWLSNLYNSRVVRPLVLLNLNN